MVFEGSFGIYAGYFRDDLEDILVIYKGYVRSMLNTFEDTL